MADLDGFVADLIRERGLGEQDRADILAQLKSRIDDMILDNLESEAALDEYDFLSEAKDQDQLRAFLVEAIPDLEAREQRVLEEFRSSYMA